MSNIIFYNQFHNGDLHVSRTFVSEICKYMGYENNQYTYAHPNSPNILEDIPGLIQDKSHIHNVKQQWLINKTQTATYVNTWFGSDNYTYMNRHNGVTFDCLYFMFIDICKHLGFDMLEISKDPFYFFPSINFSKLQLQNIDAYVKNNANDKILICNGHAQSGQATNFNMTDIIKDLSKIYRDKTFILTSKEADFNKNEYPNIVYSSDIIKKDSCDLNEVAYLANACSLVIGRASGPFSFALCKENLTPDKKFITFSTLAKEGVGDFFLGHWGVDNIKYQSKVIQSHATNPNDVKRIIQQELS